jgi:hypothetical protein
MLRPIWIGMIEAPLAPLAPAIVTRQPENALFTRVQLAF